MIALNGNEIDQVMIISYVDRSQLFVAGQKGP